MKNWCLFNQMSTHLLCPELPQVFGKRYFFQECLKINITLQPLLIRYQTFFQTANGHLELSAKQSKWNHNSSLILHPKASLPLSWNMVPPIHQVFAVVYQDSPFWKHLHLRFKSKGGFLVNFFSFKLKRIYSNGDLICLIFFTHSSRESLITAFFFVLASMIKRILKILIFLKIIFLSMEAHC